MGTLYKTGKLVIVVFGNDHPPAHFHVITPDGQVRIEIRTLTVIDGKISRRAMDVALKMGAAERSGHCGGMEQLEPTFPDLGGANER